MIDFFGFDGTGKVPFSQGKDKKRSKNVI
ncbi:hypothetical protein RB2501_12657 [Robiginitalea biformata HTCC2501]|uniref:Uncharacterized protein n=1 Tax=Robiginitalea biformata (strain ATCC BAA-864 / DSM 15991 / KCTC 12146 / HTCC2501) TaxID=313596 RepID=A4CND8_ROBBH|nr:hypothetical protein RB2501_12657 [Robiginitalea biformata HTCC2501]